MDLMNADLCLTEIESEWLKSWLDFPVLRRDQFVLWCLAEMS